MTAGVSSEAVRAAAPTSEELRRQLLALVLAFVLVWYTVVVPAHPASAAPRRPAPDEGGGEVRGAAQSPPGEAVSRRDDDLDWPEFIYP